MHTVKRTLLVTGASSGIGRAIARQLLQAGHRIIGTSRDCNKFTVNHPLFSFIELDLSLLDQIPKKIRSLERNFPALDGAIFSAGYGQFGAVEQFSYAQIEQLITVNFTSQAFITRALIPKFKKKTQSNLIYIGSEAALTGSRKGAIYCAGKFALRGFTQALRDECSSSPVRVSLINPGMVKTPFFDNLSFQPGKGDTHGLLAEDVADTVIYILNSNNNMVIDEINLNPANKVIDFNKGAGKK